MKNPGQIEKKWHMEHIDYVMSVLYKAVSPYNTDNTYSLCNVNVSKSMCLPILIHFSFGPIYLP